MSTWMTTILFLTGAFFTRPPTTFPISSDRTEDLLNALRLIKVEDFCPGSSLTLVMNDDVGKALAFLQDE